MRIMTDAELKALIEKQKQRAFARDLKRRVEQENGTAKYFDRKEMDGYFIKDTEGSVKLHINQEDLARWAAQDEKDETDHRSGLTNSMANEQAGR